jgi:hypothetical protein
MNLQPKIQISSLATHVKHVCGTLQIILYIQCLPSLRRSQYVTKKLAGNL